jgi:hypothetical protein
VDVYDVVKDTRGDVHTSCVSIFPKQQQQQHHQQQHHQYQQQQQQQSHEAATRVVQALKEQLQQHLCATTHPHNQQQQQAPWHSCQQGCSPGHVPLETVPESSSVQCVNSSAYVARAARMPAAASAAPWSPQHQHQQPQQHQQQHQQQQQPNQHQPQPHQQQELDQEYCLQLMTVERYSRLWFYLQRAWVGAHMRAILAAAGAPGERGQ